MATSNRDQACVFGLSWGDEGKGKIVDLICPAFDAVVRFNGGANAGHTVCVGDETFALHLLPSGVLHTDVLGIIGTGVVVDPLALLSEIDGLAVRGLDVMQRLWISDRAHLVMPYHKLEDQLSEKAASDGSRIGTTARGIGPCYADKMKRSDAVRFSDLMNPASLVPRVKEIVAKRRVMLGALYGEDFDLDVESVLADLETARKRLSDCVCDTGELLLGAVADGKAVLFEGANGVLLDVDHGTYPYVTSSSSGPHGIWSGSGIPPFNVVYRIGTTKAYATRVGAGPFVSELKDDLGDRIREAGHEYGTTTGRPRRCGWFDAVSCKYAAAFSGVTDIALTHLDTLSGFKRIGICVAYKIDGRTVTRFPADTACLERAEPVLEYLPGWEGDLRTVKSFGELPRTAISYLERIESLVGAPVSIAGVGPDRTQTLVRGRLAHMIQAGEPTVVQ